MTIGRPYRRSRKKKNRNTAHAVEDLYTVVTAYTHLTDRCYAKNLDDLGCFGCVLPDGSAIARESWTGNGFVEDDKFEEKYKKAVADNMDGFLTVLDIHD